MYVIRSLLDMLSLLLYCSLPIIVIAVIVFVILISIYMFFGKKYKLLIFVILCFLITVFMFLNTDFIKSRKHVNTEWMIGHTIYEVRFRYSYPKDRSKYDEERDIDGDSYLFCVREIYEYNFLDGILGESRYYVKIDEDGIIIDVKRADWGGFGSASEYPYIARW